MTAQIKMVKIGSTANYMTYVKRYSKTPWGELIRGIATRSDNTTLRHMSNISIGSDYTGGAFVWKAFPPTHPKNRIRPRDANEEDMNPVVTFCGDGTQASQEDTIRRCTFVKLALILTQY